jgi:hypothetical protein
MLPWRATMDLAGPPFSAIELPFVARLGGAQ